MKCCAAAVEVGEWTTRLPTCCIVVEETVRGGLYSLAAELSGVSEEEDWIVCCSECRGGEIGGECVK